VPNLDVTDLLLDPDFATAGLICLRSQEVVGQDGVAVQTPAQQTFTGVVTAGKGAVLDRLDGASRTRDSILIHTTFRLRVSAAGYAADVVIWQGNRYTVSQVNDYSTFGRGFVAATCDLQALTD
jgi:hypothetical protein